MSRKQPRVPVHLDTQGIKSLEPEEIAAILRGADELIMSGGRSMLAKILKGSQDKKLLELELETCPVYGYYRHLTLPDITARIGWVIRKGFLAYQYEGRLPLLVFTPTGWEVERENYANELLQGFDRLLVSGAETFDMAYLKDRNRGLILLLLDKLEASGDKKYLPLLDAWAAVDYKKVRERISQVMKTLTGGSQANDGLDWAPKTDHPADKQ